MRRLTAGIILLALFVFVMVTFLLSPPYTDVFSFTLVWLFFTGIPGGALAYFGIRAMRRHSKIVREALVMYQKGGSIDALKIAESVHEDAAVVAQTMIDAQRKGFLPKEARVPSMQTQPTPQQQKVVICTNCDTDSPLGTKFCPNCGRALFA